MKCITLINSSSQIEESPNTVESVFLSPQVFAAAIPETFKSRFILFAMEREPEEVLFLFCAMKILGHNNWKTFKHVVSHRGFV